MACAYAVDQLARNADGAGVSFDTEKTRLNFGQGALGTFKGLKRMARPDGKPEPHEGLENLARHSAARVQRDRPTKGLSRSEPLSRLLYNPHGLFYTVVRRCDQNNVGGSKPRTPGRLSVPPAYKARGGLCRSLRAAYDFAYLITGFRGQATERLSDPARAYDGDSQCCQPLLLNSAIRVQANRRERQFLMQINAL
jgi:hypothetical protein